MKGHQVRSSTALILLALLAAASGCSPDTPLFSHKPEQAENNDAVINGRKIFDWRRDLRAFRNVKKVILATVALSEAGTLAVPGLRKDLEDSLARNWAAKTLVAIGPEAASALPDLETALSKPDTLKSGIGGPFKPWGHAAMISIRQDPAGHIDQMITLLGTKDKDIRFFTCQALRELGDLASTPDRQ
jgi:hypothetical protein